MDPSAPVAQPPVFALAGDEPAVIAFSSVEEAEGYVEPWDLNDGLWKFWDSNGYVLMPPGRVDEKRSWTRLELTADAEPEVLRSTLVRGLRSVGVDDPALDRLPLGELCELAGDRLQMPPSGWSGWAPIGWLRNRLRWPRR